MSTQKLPHWAIKPKHKLEVIATEKGWVVKETNELLASIKDLKSRLEQLSPKKEEPKPLAKVETKDETPKETELVETSSTETDSASAPVKRKYTRRK